jgi:hypothetical protein
MRSKREKIKASQLHGFKYFKVLSGLLERLQDAGCQRDRAGNRTLHMDQYIALLLLYMFNPICTSLRALQQASELKRNSSPPGLLWAVCPNRHESLTVNC